MPRFLTLILLTLALPASLLAADLKPRVIVLTDLKRTQETDDSESVVRLLAHADLVEIEGIVVSAGVNYWEPEHAIDGYAYAFELLDAYARSVENLKKMSGQGGFQPVEERQELGYWPSPHYLVQRTVLGTPMQGLDQTGPGRDNAGSRLIASVVDEADERPVCILAWGGPNVLAQTMRDLTENPAQRRDAAAVAAFLRKIRVVAIGDQDQPWPMRREAPVPNNAGRWLRERFPDMFWMLVNGTGFHASKRDAAAFYQAHVQGHGPLGDAYPDHNHGIEGDTPSLLHVLPLGIADLERPDWGSPAGTHVHGMHSGLSARVWMRPPAGEVARYSEDLGRRCADALWRLFAARMDWARSGTGNRPPQAIVDGDKGLQVLRRKAHGGETVVLDASASRDGEMDRLAFAWEQMILPGAWHEALQLAGSDGARVEMQVPPEASGTPIHLLLTVTDEGAGHALSAWRHVVIEVAP